jgi:hypothetical protein
MSNMRFRAVCAAAILALLPIEAVRADTPVLITQAIEAAIAANGNASQILQVGSNNYAETDQFGAQNYAQVGQFGDSNSAKIVQNSVGAIAVYQQYGNSNQVTITQTGVRPQPVVVTQRR